MNHLYEFIKVSKQAVFQQKAQVAKTEVLANQIVEQIIKLRMKHPVMGLKKLYNLLKPSDIGRDKFIEIAINNGLQAVKPRSFKRTTYPAKGFKYANLLENKLLQM